jgi:steroid delta-isomerase-like uncharacterized protein
MSTEDNKAVMRRVYEEVYNQRNLAAIDELGVPNFVFHNASLTMQGLEAYRQFVSQFLSAFPDSHFTIEDLLAEGDSVVVRHTFRGTHQGDFMGIPPTGKSVIATGISLSGIQNGKGVEAWVNGDDLGLMQQLGVIPSVE